MLHFANETIDLDQLPKYEETKLNAPHASYWRVILINLLICLLLLSGALAMLFFLNQEIRPYLVPMGIAYLLVWILLFVLYRASFKKRGFALREKDIMYKSGIIAETTTIIPLNRIQHVALEEGLFSRMYGLATLQLFTAGGQSGHMHIAGIPIAKARVIKEALVKRLDLIENPAIEAQ
ncbi:PH domain-containing protein [Pedobacter sp. ASV12]|uniref:PH domain-containing protein n=1 Tax=Pedobacter sp. ASV12 TaxID=2795120 RepID=UPI0018EAED86|nr:PH domain-containing protein [Pedobacter sp. ASV12]